VSAARRAAIDTPPAVVRDDHEITATSSHEGLTTREPLSSTETSLGAVTARASEADGPAIETTGLSKRYGSTTALAGLTMRVERGEVFGFLGPNGAGKTTAVKLLLGLARATGGSGQLLGAPLGDRSARRRVGYLPELFRYQPWMRARDVLRLHCELAGIDRRRWRDEIDDALATIGLTDRGADLVGRFSKGMQQRLGLGVALLGAPDLVFLDEPTSALDPVGRVDVRSIITAARARGTTVFLNSHLLTEVERVCDRVAIVDRGRVVAEGRIDALLGEPGVRIRVTGLDPADGRLAAFGPLTTDGDWLTIRPIDPARVPDVVAAIVQAGGRVHAVDPARATLEDRFLALFADPGARPPAEPPAARDDRS
jgi:ABC-2 type transport system ATP-binding protein